MIFLSLITVQIIQSGILLFALKKIVRYYRCQNNHSLNKEVFFYLFPSVVGMLIAVLIRSMEQKYRVKISLVDFSNEKQADSYIMGSSGGNNIAIASQIAEKMAKDPAAAAKYEKVIADVPNASKIMEKGIASHDSEMVACGVSIDKDGKVSYWSVSKHKPSKYSSYKEKIEKQTEEKRAKEKRLAKAETLEKLLEKLKTTAEYKKLFGDESGSHVDFTA